MHNDVNAEATFQPSPIKVISNYLAIKLPFFLNTRGIYDFGSSVYGYKTPADRDVVYVISPASTDITAFDEHFKLLIDSVSWDIRVVDQTSFMQHLNSHQVYALECCFLKDEHIHLQAVEMDLLFSKFKINCTQLRHSLSSTASNSFVKAKKKLIIPADFDLECSIKSLWHSMRILKFGAELATKHSIDFSSANYLYPEIIEAYKDSHCNWDEIHKIFKPKYNELHSALVKVAPK